MTHVKKYVEFVRISQNSAKEIDKTFAKIEMFLILCT